jgi:DNA polymerase I-like protein with 3'-5' exonuclease and polymerase domains
MKILFVGSSFFGDENYLDSLSRLPALRGCNVATSFMKRETAYEITLICKQKNFEAVICAQPELLERILYATPDFIPPPKKKAITLDDYAGSLLYLPNSKIPVIVVNPLFHLVQTASGKFLANRYITKITFPDGWFKQTPFTWSRVTEQSWQEDLERIASATLIACDIETSQEDRAIDLVGYCCRFADGTTHTFVAQFNSEWAYDFVRSANATRAPKIFQHGQYDNAYFLRWNCPVVNWRWDTLTLMHCWYSELPKRLDFIASFSLREIRYWKDDGKSGSVEDEMRYNARDCWATLNSFLAMISEVPEYVFANYILEFKMNFPALHAAMEGIKVDKEVFFKVQAEKAAEAEQKLEQLRYVLAAEGFNPRSPVQMKSLFQLLGVGHLPDTAAASMLKARAAAPINDLILGIAVDYKKAAKLNSTYLIEEKFWNWRCYYEIDPAGTDTLRAASKESVFWCGLQIQNIPRGDSIKQFMIADDGWELAEADKAQSEARCVGYMSGETKLIDLVESPRDYHAWNAQAFFGVPYELIYEQATKKTLDKDLRDLSKRTNHGVNYNMGPDVMLDTMGPKKVAQAKVKLGIKGSLRTVCQYLLERYEATYPKVKGLFYDTVVSTINRESKLVSALGWTRYFFAKPSKANKPALNAAVAHGPQNLSVSIINEEWFEIWAASVYGDLRGLVRIKAQIHDSILFQYPAGRKEIAEEVCSRMNTAVEVKGADGVTRTMVIPSDLKCGDSRWSNLK